MTSLAHFGRSGRFSEKSLAAPRCHPTSAGSPCSVYVERAAKLALSAGERRGVLATISLRGWRALVWKRERPRRTFAGRRSLRTTSAGALMLRNLGALDDRELLVLAQSDREAFAELYRRHVAGILAYFSRALDRSDLAFDLTAETFAAALLALPGYKPTAAPGRSWLYSIAHNRLVDCVRRGQAEARAREQIGMQAIVLSNDGEAVIDSIIARIDGRSALEVVQDLPADQRDALVARFVKDQNYAEIAAEFQCSEQVVRKRVSRGLTAVGARLARRSDGRRSG